MLQEREDEAAAAEGRTTERLAGEVLALVSEWLPPGRTASVAVVDDLVRVTIVRAGVEGRGGRTWVHSTHAADLAREGGVKSAAGAALHHAALEVAAFRVWRRERATGPVAVDGEARGQ